MLYNIFISFKDNSILSTARVDDFETALKKAWDLMEELYNSTCAQYSLPHRVKILKSYNVVGYPPAECENRYREYLKDRMTLKISHNGQQDYYFKGEE